MNDKSSSNDNDPGMPWVEKYRPDSLSDIVSHHEIIETINRFITRNQLPHLLFHGPPGTGKTSVAHAISKKLYGDEHHQMVLELNASDDRGIDVVRNTIKSFAETTPNRPNISMYKLFEKSTKQRETTEDSQTDHSNSSIIKIVILDEADQMTSTAQMALRRIIENYAKFVRFFIIANILNKINPALQSRCTKFRFAPLRHHDIVPRVTEICAKENVPIEPSGIEALITLGRGDMRKIINYLQCCVLAYSHKKIDEETVFNLFGIIQPSSTNQLLFDLTVSSFSECFNNIKNLISNKGYSLQDILTNLHHFMMTYDLPFSVISFFYPCLADIEYRLAQGSDEIMQAASVVSLFIKIREHLTLKLDQTLKLEETLKLNETLKLDETLKPK